MSCCSRRAPARARRSRIWPPRPDGCVPMSRSSSVRRTAPPTAMIARVSHCAADRAPAVVATVVPVAITDTDIGADADDELPPPSSGDPNPAPTIPVPAPSRPAPGMCSTGPWWSRLGSWRRHWRTARRRTTRTRAARRWRHGLPMGDNGKRHDCKRRQHSSSMYHGILQSPLLASSPTPRTRPSPHSRSTTRPLRSLCDGG